jgi:hypothetical protein
MSVQYANIAMYARQLCIIYYLFLEFKVHYITVVLCPCVGCDERSLSLLYV